MTNTVRIFYEGKLCGLVSPCPGTASIGQTPYITTGAWRVPCKDVWYDIGQEGELAVVTFPNGATQRFRIVHGPERTPLRTTLVAAASA